MCERDVFGREALVCRQALHGDEYTGETLLTERRGRRAVGSDVPSASAPARADVPPCRRYSVSPSIFICANSAPIDVLRLSSACWAINRRSSSPSSRWMGR